MTDEQIIEMAKQAWSDAGEGWVVDRWFNGRAKAFIAFAKLAAQHEREACAEMCKKHADVYGAFEPTPSFQAAWAACIDLRDTIRARGEV